MKVARLILALMVLTAGVGCIHPVHEARPVRDLAGAGMNEPPAEARAAAWVWTGVAWSSDGSRVAGGNGDGTVRVWDVASGREVGHAAGYRRRDGAREGVWDAGVMAFSPDGGRLAFTAEDGRVRVWEIGSGRVTELVGQPRQVRAVRFTADGRRVVTASGGLLTSPIRTRAVTRPATVIEPTTVIVFDAETGRVVSRAVTEGFLAVAFAPDGERFVGLRVVGDNAEAVEVRRVTGEKLEQAVPGRLEGWLLPRFSPDGRWLLGGGQVWDTASWRAVRDVPWSEGRAFVDGGRRVLCIRRGTGTGSLLQPLGGGPSWVELKYVDVRRGTTHDAGRWTGWGLEASFEWNESRVSPDGRWLVDGMMRVWEVPR